VNDNILEKDCDTLLVWNAISRELKFDRQLQLTEKKHFSIGRLQRRYATAAVIFILLGGSILYYSKNDFIQEKLGMVAQAKTLFQTTDDETRLVILPDGSRIQLNRGTRFSYITHAFNRKQREVWLEGEAFFDVAKNKEKPFIIHTGTMQTTVRGTSFNIKAYTQTGQNVVSVRTGKVEVCAQNKVLAMLTPNKQIIYNTAKRTSETESIKTSDITVWTNGCLVLNNANISELRLRLKQCFNVNLQVDGQALNRAKFNAVFKTGTSLDEVMQTISILYEIKYKTAPSGDIIIFS
jgi:transmembrane sensor